jgi:hypothetical protein
MSSMNSLERGPESVGWSAGLLERDALERLSSELCAAVGGSCVVPPLERLEADLTRVHQREQARLLRAAALLACRRRSEESVCLAAFHGSGGEQRWRSEAQLEHASARIDGEHFDGRLAACLEPEAPLWAAPRALAAAAAELDPGAESRFHCALVELALGSAQSAALAFAAARAEATDERSRVRALEAEALAWQQAGEGERSLAALAAFRADDRPRLRDELERLVRTLERLPVGRTAR